MRVSRPGVVVCSLPGLLSLGLFYSLAIHMYLSLGRWPSSIGEGGFSPALSLHANVATTYFWLLFLISIFTVPVAIVSCLFFSRTRHLVFYFVLHAWVFIISILLMLLSPAPFLYWWVD